MKTFQNEQGKTISPERVWYIGGKYKRAPKRKKQKGGEIPFGLIASLAGPILAEIAKPIFKKILGRRRRRKIKKW